MGKLKDRTGERRLMNCGEYATVIAYRHSYDIDVRFDVFNKNYYSFQSGGINHPAFKKGGVLNGKF